MDTDMDTALATERTATTCSAVQFNYNIVNKFYLFSNETLIYDSHATPGQLHCLASQAPPSSQHG